MEGAHRYTKVRLLLTFSLDNLPFALRHVNGYHRMPVSRKKAEISETQATYEVTLSLKILPLIYEIGDLGKKNPSTMAELSSTELPQYLATLYTIVHAGVITLLGIHEEFLKSSLLAT